MLGRGTLVVKIAQLVNVRSGELGADFDKAECQAIEMALQE